MKGARKQSAMTLFLTVTLGVSAAAQDIGEHKWSLKLATGSSGRVPVIGEDGGVYCTHGDALFAIDRDMGLILWEFIPELLEGERASWSTPVVGANGTVYAIVRRSGLLDLHAIDGTSGVSRWSIGTTTGVPTVARDGTVFLGQRGRLLAVDGNSGDRKWVLNFRGSIPSTAIGVDGTLYASVYVSDLQQDFLSLDQASGEVNWRRSIKNGSLNGHIKIGPDGNLFKGVAVHWASGEILADCALGDFTAVGPDGVFYIASRGKVSAVIGATGEFKWSVTTGVWNSSNGEPLAPSIALSADGRLFVTSEAGLLALDSSTGLQVAELPLVRRRLFDVITGTINSLSLDSEGRLYIRGDYAIHAIDVGSQPANTSWPVSGASSSQSRTLESSGAPRIISQPKALAVVEGTSATLSVLATGEQPLEYVWFKDGEILDGEDDERIILSNFQNGSSGLYRAVVSNALGSVESQEVYVGVGYPLAVSIEGTGRAKLSPPGGVYAPGTVVQLQAHPRKASDFRKWSGDVESLELNTVVTVDRPLEVTAGFGDFPGSLKWSLPVPGNRFEIDEPVIGPEGMLYLSAGEVEESSGPIRFVLSSIDLTERRINWMGEPAANGTRPIVTRDGLLYHGVRPGNLVAVHAASGGILWDLMLEDFGDFRVSVSPALGLDGSIVVSAAVGFTYAFHPSRLPLWATEIGHANYMPAIGQDGTIYASPNASTLHALDPATGLKIWSFRTRGDVTGAAVDADGTVFVGGRNKRFYAVNGITGEEKWASEASSHVDGEPAIGIGGVYFQVGDHSLEALDTGDGSRQWLFNAGARISPPVVGSDGTVYVTSDSNHYSDLGDAVVYALDGETGNVRWSFSERGNPWFTAAVIGMDGTVYVVGREKLYALTGTTTDPPIWPSAAGPDFARRLQSFPDRGDIALDIQSTAEEGQQITARWTGDRDYVLESSSDLKSWTPLRQLDEPSKRVTLDVNHKTNLPSQFYRIHTE